MVSDIERLLKNNKGINIPDWLDIENLNLSKISLKSITIPRKQAHGTYQMRAYLKKYKNNLNPFGIEETVGNLEKSNHSDIKIIGFKYQNRPILLFTNIELTELVGIVCTIE